MYDDACAVISALADHLKASASASSEGRYFFGEQPSSLDALLAGHLLYYRSSPTVAPVLQQKVRMECGHGSRHACAWA